MRLAQQDGGAIICGTWLITWLINNVKNAGLLIGVFLCTLLITER
ncbi:MAG: hypothetical protein ACRCR6_12000 [Plesiomonas sp.]